LKSFILILALAAAVTARASDQLKVEGQVEDVNTASEKPAEKPKVVIDIKKVNANIESIVRRVSEMNKDLIGSAEAKLKESDYIIRRTLILTLAAKGKIFNDLGIEAQISDLNIVGNGLLDTASVKASLAVNGYELLKKALSTPRKSDERTSQQVISENLERGKKACEAIDTVTAENVSKKGYTYLECAISYHLLNSTNFSEFLVGVKPLADKFKTIANDSYFETLKAQYGEAGARVIYYALTRNSLQVCTKELFSTCLGREYLYASLSGNTLFLSRVGGSLMLTEKKIELSISFYSIRALTNAAGSVFGKEGFDPLKYQILKDIQELNAEGIELVAKEIHQGVGWLRTELERIGLK